MGGNRAYDAGLFVSAVSAVQGINKPHGMVRVIGPVDDPGLSPPEYVASVEQPTQYLVDKQKLDAARDHFEAIIDCPIIYDSDQMKMANETIDRMRRLIKIGVDALSALNDGR